MFDCMELFFTPLLWRDFTRDRDFSVHELACCVSVLSHSCLGKTRQSQTADSAPFVAICGVTLSTRHFLVTAWTLRASMRSQMFNTPSAAQQALTARSSPEHPLPATGMSTCQAQGCVRVSLYAGDVKQSISLCSNMTSSAKTEIRNVSLCHQRRTEPQPWVTCTKKR